MTTQVAHAVCDVAVEDQVAAAAEKAASLTGSLRLCEATRGHGALRR